MVWSDYLSLGLKCQLSRLTYLESNARGKLELHISRRENGKWLPGNFPAGNGRFPGKFPGFDQIWPKMGKNDQNLTNLAR